MVKLEVPIMDSMDSSLERVHPVRATFRHHAMVRLQQRTSLEPEAFLGMLDGNLSVSVGVEPFTRRRHRLIYSVADRAHFVAIQDFETGEVVTVLPIDYHENLAWGLSEKALRKAVRLADPDLHQVLYPPPPPAPPPPGVGCQLVGVFFDKALRSLKYSFGAHRFQVFPESPEEVLEEESFIGKLLAKVQQKKQSRPMAVPFVSFGTGLPKETGGVIENEFKDFWAPRVWMGLGCPTGLSEAGQIGLLRCAQEATAATGCPIDFQQAAQFQSVPQG